MSKVDVDGGVSRHRDVWVALGQSRGDDLHHVLAVRLQETSMIPCATCLSRILKRLCSTRLYLPEPWRVPLSALEHALFAPQTGVICISGGFRFKTGAVDGDAYTRVNEVASMGSGTRAIAMVRALEKLEIMDRNLL